MKASVLLPAWLLLRSVVSAFQVPPGQARLVVYRHREFNGTTYNLKLNDKSWAGLPTNRYLQLDVPPGRVKLESVKDYFSENQTLWLTLQPGRTYYVKAVEEVDFLTRTLLLAPMSDEQGQREVQGLKPASAPRAQ